MFHFVRVLLYVPQAASVHDINRIYDAIISLKNKIMAWFLLQYVDQISNFVFIGAEVDPIYHS